MFPHTDPIDLTELLHLDEPLVLSAAEIVDLLGPQLRERRKERIDEVICERTFCVVPVMDGVYDLGNVAAVLRSAEGMGYQEAHFIDTQPDHKPAQRITQGADKWLDLHRWREPSRCVKALKERGYLIAATHLDADVELEEMDFTKPTALVFGNEHDGVSQEVLEQADLRCVIPLRGFIQSFNISVAAAIALYEALKQRIEVLGSQGDLDEEQREILRALFYVRASNQPGRLIPRLWRRRHEGERS